VGSSCKMQLIQMCRFWKCKVQSPKRVYGGLVGNGGKWWGIVGNGGRRWGIVGNGGRRWEMVGPLLEVHFCTL
jgi:hypothetical protein